MRVPYANCDFADIRSRHDSRSKKPGIKTGFIQIERFTHDKDLVAMLTRGHHLKTGVLVFVGVKDVQYWASQP